MQSPLQRPEQRQHRVRDASGPHSNTRGAQPKVGKTDQSCLPACGGGTHGACRCGSEFLDEGWDSDVRAPWWLRHSARPAQRVSRVESWMSPSSLRRAGAPPNRPTTGSRGRRWRGPSSTPTPRSPPRLLLSWVLMMRVIERRETARRPPPDLHAHGERGAARCCPLRG